MRRYAKWSKVDVSKYSFDNLRRAWVVCPHCSRKTPAWTSNSRFVQIRGICKWCKEEWKIEEVSKNRDMG